MEFSNFEIVQMVVDVFLVAVVIYCVPKLRGYQRMVQVMTAESSTVVTDAKLIDEWEEKRDSLKKGCPKWIAYNNRLKEFGRAK